MAGIICPKFYQYRCIHGERQRRLVTPYGPLCQNRAYGEWLPFSECM